MKRETLAVIALIAVVVITGLAFYELNPQTSRRTCGTSPGGDDVWTTYHLDNSRTGYQPSQNPACASPGWMSQQLDGEIYAEPLVFGDTVFVATENDSVYALNALTGGVVWRTHVGDPVPRSALPCGNIDPTGITGTPVIDIASRTLYAVAFVEPGKHLFVALDVNDGAVKFTRSADPQEADPTVEQQRGALALADGIVYAPYGGLFGDCGQYHGWVVGVRSDGTGDLLAYEVPTGRAGGIWAPSGPAVDSSGAVYVATGNSGSTTSFDYGNSVIKLSPELQQLSFFAPPNWADLNGADTDLGSVGPALVGQSSLFQIGKEGVGYLVDTSAMGGVGSQLFSLKVCSSAYGGTAFDGSTLFVPCSDGLVALIIDGSSFRVAWRGPSFSAGPPVVTGNTVWTVDPRAGMIYGFDAANGSQLFSFDIGPATRFTTPAVGDGTLFVAAGHQVVSFTLT